MADGSFRTDVPGAAVGGCGRRRVGWRARAFGAAAGSRQGKALGPFLVV